jgi:hypothetical protein
MLEIWSPVQQCWEMGPLRSDWAIETALVNEFIDSWINGLERECLFYKSKLCLLGLLCLAVWCSPSGYDEDEGLYQEPAPFSWT